ncbi:uncharacterized protein BKCO1_4000198 [Diplodia corticola]|uniref:T6SS Phospholipase effector Tle1-like catalytic domain-containing protein n=1 Tax=Diplodia corticola TaxID=236234 RepID=A0A1J9RDJ0_9PEZI|nr:uncharacterized protein BKCO1_4000198 [Diplodia corticola]OJD38608.1 hypothetical protein BKCO1_4000198 [Diplodia corticola]
MDRDQTIARKIIICCDGTACNATLGTNLTNVSRISRCICASDENGNPQIVFYQPGVGTDPHNPMDAANKATGLGINQNIREAYSFICDNYEREHDEIYLIGFSRGAYTVRCIAQLIGQVGLLTKARLFLLPGIFRDWKEGKLILPQLLDWLYKTAAYRHPDTVRIQACAVWDTVSTLGNPLKPRTKPYQQLIPDPLCFINSDLYRNIRYAFQALALHERRSKYPPMVWRIPENPPPQNGPVLEQCWFTGCHSDIGGGKDNDSHAHLALVWMVSKLQDHLRFDLNNLGSPSFAQPPGQIIQRSKTSSWGWSRQAQPGNSENHFIESVQPTAADALKVDVRAIAKVQDSLKAGYRVLGSSNRKPRCHFWSRDGFEEVDPGQTDIVSNESMHFSVRVLRRHNVIKEHGILKNAVLDRRPGGGNWAWTLRLSDQSQAFEVVEHAVDDSEHGILQEWLNQELEFLQAENQMDSGNPRTIIAELLASLA